MAIKYLLQRITEAKSILDELESYIQGMNQVREVVMNGNGKIELFFDEKSNSFISSNGMDPDQLISYIYELNQKNATSVNKLTDKEEDIYNMPTIKEGSITKRKDGRWMGRYRDNGIQKSVYAHTKIEIINKLNDAIQKRDSIKKFNNSTVKKITFSEFINIWFDNWKSGKSRTKPLSDRTVSFVESTLIKYVRNHHIATKQLTKITPEDLDIILNDIPTRYLQGRTYGYIKLVFDKAFQKEIILKNPFDRIDKRAIPSATKKTMPDIKTWLNYMEWLKTQSIEIYYFSEFLASTGLRIGEALALTWTDIDLISSRIVVNKSFSIATQKLVNHPKTDAGIRRIPIFPKTQEVIDLLPKSGKSNEVFWFISKWSCSKQITKYIRKFGEFNLTAHGLRHLFASICRANGIDKKTYSRWMGHENITMTDDYTHEISEFEYEQILKMANSKLF